MIKSANQYPVHALLSHESNIMYRVPPYQREYSWQKGQWEDLFEDLVEADGAHFLGTIITLDQTLDAVSGGILELIDGQQRMTTLTLLLSAVYSVLMEHHDELDDDTRTDLVNLGRQLIKKGERLPRVTPQTQGHNLDDYRAVLSDAGFDIDSTKRAYFPMRRVYRCFRYFRDSIARLAESEQISVVDAANRVREAAQKAVLVKIEVASHADAFVLFESLNNRGMPLTPVDLIKNHLLAESERRKVMGVEEAFKRWNEVLTNLGDSYTNQERFLRHYYNAFRGDLSAVSNAPVATRANLIRIYEALLVDDIIGLINDLAISSEVYGRITCVSEPDDRTELDDAFRRLMRAQGAPSYILVMWAMRKRNALALTDDHLLSIADLLTNFFVRRNMTGLPQTYMLPRLFMNIVDAAGGLEGSEVVELVRNHLRSVSVPDQEFAARLNGPIYAENSDMARFILTTLSEDQMTKETWADLWRYEKGHYVWTIEHILPQGENLPASWKEMLGGVEAAAAAQEVDVHRLGNLTITAYNSTLSNKSFADKRDRTDAQGRYIGYRNGLSLNAGLVEKSSWTVADIDSRTAKLAEAAVARFPL